MKNIPPLASITIAIFLILGVLPWPYEYYILLRFAVFSLCGYAALLMIKHSYNIQPYLIPMIICAVIFNPFIPLHFNKGIWVIIDLVTGIGLVYLTTTTPLNYINDGRFDLHFRLHEFLNKSCTRLNPSLPDDMITSVHVTTIDGIMPLFNTVSIVMIRGNYYGFFEGDNAQMVVGVEFIKYGSPRDSADKEFYSYWETPDQEVVGRLLDIAMKHKV